MSVITEGNVSSNILSFVPRDFLYTGTVCKAWHENSPGKSTSILRALDSLQMLNDAIAAGMDCLELLDLAIVFGAGVDVVSRISETRECDTSVVVHYAAFTGNVQMLKLLRAPLDEFCLYEAVRGRQHDLVWHILNESRGCVVNILPQWPFVFYDDDDFVDRCIAMAEANSNCDVAQALKHYTSESYYQCDFTCLELAIRMDRVSMVHLLYEGGATIPGNAFAIAVDCCGLDMLRYLKSDKSRPGENFLMDYMSSETFSADNMQILLEHGLVELHAGDLQQALHTSGRRVADLLLQFGCPVNNETIDHAVATWDFALATRLMGSYGCHPTSQAYEWLFTGALCACCVEGFYPTGADDFYLSKLNWIFSATSGDLGFQSFSEMEADHNWTILLPRLSTAIVEWFQGRFTGCKVKKQRCE